MKKWLFALISSSLLFLSILPAAEAHVAQPQTSICSGGCTAYQYWNGTNSGMFVEFTVSNPTLNNSPALYERFAAVVNTSSNYKILVGIEKTKATTNGFCPVGGPWYFVAAYDDEIGYNNVLCKAVPSTDINTLSGFQISPYSSNGGGMDIYIWSYNTGGERLTEAIPLFDTTQIYTQIRYQEQIFDDVVGHQVWGSHWQFSEYYDSHGTGLHYQTRGPDAIWADDPPQMYWNPYPNSSNSGGTLNSCVYDGGATCNFGS